MLAIVGGALYFFSSQIFFNDIYYLFIFIMTFITYNEKVYLEN